MADETKGSGKHGASVRQFSNRVIVKKEMIELLIPAGGKITKINFPLVENLRFTHIMGLEVYHFADFPKSIITGKTVISQTLLRSIFITMQIYNGKNFLWYEPAINFHTQNVDSERSPSTMTGQKISYPKSYIQIADPTLIDAVEPQVLPVVIHYRDFADVERKDRKAQFDKQS